MRDERWLQFCREFKLNCKDGTSSTPHITYDSIPLTQSKPLILFLTHSFSNWQLTHSVDISGCCSMQPYLEQGCRVRRNRQAHACTLPHSHAGIHIHLEMPTDKTWCIRGCCCDQQTGRPSSVHIWQYHNERQDSRSEIYNGGHFLPLIPWRLSSFHTLGWNHFIIIRRHVWHINSHVQLPRNLRIAIQPIKWFDSQ